MSNLSIYESGSDALANLDAFCSTTANDVQFLKFSKGEFIYGPEEFNVDPEDHYVANMETLSKGAICWKDNKVAGEEMVPVHSGKSINIGALPEIPGSDGWSEQVSIEFTNLDTGEKLLFKTSSHGGRNALKELTKLFGDNMKRGNKRVVPVVNMISTSYKHKDYGKIFTPKFEVIDWLEPGGEQASSEEPEVEVITAAEAAPSRPSRRRPS
jgi:hypothetical protein